MHPTPTRRLAAGIALAALTLLAPPAAALAADGMPSMTHSHPGDTTAAATAAAGSTPAPAHTDDMGGMNMSDDMGGTDMSGDGATAPHGHDTAAATGRGLDSWAHRGVLITFAVLNAAALAAAALLRRRRPTTPGRARRVLPTPTAHTA